MRTPCTIMKRKKTVIAKNEKTPEKWLFAKFLMLF
jgi:hypothetical protein